MALKLQMNKHTTLGVVDPAEADGSICSALAKAEQKGPGPFFLQQFSCSFPADEPHDGPEAHTHNITRAQLIGKHDVLVCGPLPHYECE